MVKLTTIRIARPLQQASNWRRELINQITSPKTSALGQEWAFMKSFFGFLLTKSHGLSFRVPLIAAFQRLNGVCWFS
jgi:hypothetical protein